VLPGIDDGPADLEGAVAMAQAAADAGTRILVATPHLRADFPHVHVHELAERVDSLRQTLTGKEIDLQIVAGAEVSLVWALEASAGDLTLATYGQRGSDLLVETPAGDVVGLANFLFMLQTKGLRITLAHPERNPGFQRDPSPLADLVRQGVLLQVNADALLGSTRKSPERKLARHLCTERLAHVIASDGHRAESWRPVVALTTAATVAAKLVGEERAQWMTQGAPTAIVAGTKLPDPPLRDQAG
jgi:protein-tyrosine phosphatase